MQSLKYFVANYMPIFKIQQNFLVHEALKKQKVGKGFPFSNRII